MAKEEQVSKAHPKVCLYQDTTPRISQQERKRGSEEWREDDKEEFASAGQRKEATFEAEAEIEVGTKERHFGPKGVETPSFTNAEIEEFIDEADRKSVV